VPIEVPNGTQIDLVVDDGANPPLDLTGAFAIVSPRPWIYFDSADGQPLVARLGDSSLKPPTYDLEAVRPNLPTITPVSAIWGAAPALQITTSAPDVSPEALAAAPLVGADLDVSRFRYTRTVPSGRVGLTALTLDAAVLAHSSLVDLRLVNRDGHQLAYLLESRDEPLTIALEPNATTTLPAWMSRWPRAEGHHLTTYLLQLPQDAAPDSRLVLTTNARVFTRQVTVLAEQPASRPGDLPYASTLTAMNWTHAEPNEPAPQLTLDLPPLRTKELVLVVDEGDNAPLKIESARMLLPGYAMRFFRSDASPLTLYYGNDRLGAPRYDLALLQPYLLGVPATDLVAEPEQAPAAVAAPTTLPTWAFWSVLIAAVLILLALIWRLLRAETVPPTTAA
jgi:hypothetical protein